LDYSEIRNSFIGLGVESGDFIVMHADAIVSAQIKCEKIDSKINLIYDTLIELLTDEGTLVVPDFTYSSTDDEEFNILETRSAVGLMSETFRIRKDTVRSSHPILSFSATGKYADLIAKSKFDTCFGSSSIFTTFHEKNAKIIYLGCSFDRITFTHYVEESIGVSYRYHKKFSGKIVDKDGISLDTVTDYYVRDLSIDSRIDLSLLKKALIQKNLIQIVNFGRFELGSVRANDFYDQSSFLIAEDQYALIKQKNILGESSDI